MLSACDHCDKWSCESLEFANMWLTTKLFILSISTAFPGLFPHTSFSSTLTSFSTIHLDALWSHFPYLQPTQYTHIAFFFVLSQQKILKKIKMKRAVFLFLENASTRHHKNFFNPQKWNCINNKAAKNNIKNKNNLKSRSSSKSTFSENLWSQQTNKIRYNILRVSACIILIQDSGLVYKLAYDTVKLVSISK